MFEVESQLNQLLNNEFESVELTSVDMNVAVEETVKRYTVEDLLVSTNGGSIATSTEVRVSPGSTIFLRVVLQPSDRTAERLVDMSLRVPFRVRRGGFIEVFAARVRSISEAASSSSRIAGDRRTARSTRSTSSCRRSSGSPRTTCWRLVFRMGRLRSRDTKLLDQVVSGSQVLDVRIAR
jgi:hypothetical protein